jgi:type I restriction enzyme S subunit
LGELVRLRSGGTPSKSESRYWDGDIPWLSSKDLTSGRIYDAPLKVTEAATANGTRLMPENTVMFVVRGMSLASEFRVSLTKRPCTFNQDLKAVECGNEIIPEFLFYALFAQRERIRGQAGEASHGTKKLETQTVENIRLKVPSRAVQQRVVEVAAAYDDLIENNRRRIALLEEAARLLYREWFVHFRFPGHEHVPLTDGLPEGWDRPSLSSICSRDDGIQTGPFGSQLHQSDYSEAGVPVVMPKDMRDFRISTETIAYIPEDLADKLGRHRMKVGDIVYGRRGDIGRRAFIGKRQDGYFCGTGCLRMRPDGEEIIPRFLFETLGSPETAGFIANQAKGSTMPNLSAGALKNVPIMRPTRQIQRLFVEAIEPMYEMAEVLMEQSQKLAQARDLLLPRLMNGEIAV